MTKYLQIARRASEKPPLDTNLFSFGYTHTHAETLGRSFGLVAGLLICWDATWIGRIVWKIVRSFACYSCIQMTQMYGCVASAFCIVCISNAVTGDQICGNIRWETEARLPSAFSFQPPAFCLLPAACCLLTAMEHLISLRR